MNYNKVYDFDYDDDDDYRVCLLNSYNIILTENETLDKAVDKLSTKQDLMYNKIIENSLIRSMLEEIKNKSSNYMIRNSSLDYVFIFLHSYDYFKDLHTILCAFLKEDNNLNNLCDLLKNKIIDNI